MECSPLSTDCLLDGTDMRSVNDIVMDKTNHTDDATEFSSFVSDMNLLFTHPFDDVISSQMQNNENVELSKYFNDNDSELISDWDMLESVDDMSSLQLGGPTIQLLSNAGIRQPEERRIHLHSDLAQFIACPMESPVKLSDGLSGDSLESELVRALNSSPGPVVTRDVVNVSSLAHFPAVEANVCLPSDDCVSKTPTSDSELVRQLNLPDDSIRNCVPVCLPQLQHSPICCSAVTGGVSSALVSSACHPKHVVFTKKPPCEAQQVPQISFEQLKQLLMSPPAVQSTSVINIVPSSASSVSVSGNFGPVLMPITVQNKLDKIPIARICSGPGMKQLKVQNVCKRGYERKSKCTGTDTFAASSSAPAAEGRSSHNVVEKRYRMSINDKLGELRELVDGKDSKLNKSGVLRKAIEYIKYLKNNSKRLKQENTALKFSVAEQSMWDARHHISTNGGVLITSPFSESGSDSGSSDAPPGYIGLLDRTRMFLCVFLLCLFVINPFAAMITRTHVVDGVSLKTLSRTLQNIETESRQDWSWASVVFPVFVVWLVNCGIACAVLIAMFALGEPVCKSATSSCSNYWRHRNRANVYLRQGSYVEAVGQMRCCLQSLGRPLPSTKLDLVASLLWSIVRQLTHRAGLSRLLETRVGSMCRSLCLHDIQSSAANAAVVYHKLLQLHLTDHVSQGVWVAVNLALSAANLADVAGDLLYKDAVAEIYVLAAMTIRCFLPTQLHFFARYFLSRARRLCLLRPTSMGAASLQWLCHPVGHRYFVDMSRSGRHGNPDFTTCINHADPLSHITRGLREHVMERALRALTTPGYKDHAGVSATHNSASWSKHNTAEALAYIHLLSEFSTGFEVLPEIGRNMTAASSSSTRIGTDELSCWWAAMLAVTAHWLSADDDSTCPVSAQRFYAIVECPPKSVLSSSNSLARCVYTAFKARRLWLHSADDIHSIRLCNEATELLSALAGSQHDRRSSTSFISKAVQLITYDWVLTTRSDIWLSRQHADESLSVMSAYHDLSLFQQDLSNLRFLSHSLRAAVPKMFVHEATLRLMTGANPSLSQPCGQSLRCRRRLSAQVKSCAIANGGCDQPNSNLVRHIQQHDSHMAGQKHHLTDMSTDISDILTDAGDLYAKRGDRKAFQNCCNILKQLKKTNSQKC